MIPAALVLLFQIADRLDWMVFGVRGDMLVAGSVAPVYAALFAFDLNYREDIIAIIKRGLRP
ncbi:hypothetical protein CSW64_10525 [Caulobacter mirabilis]|uniref:Uncharacterized protein n=1 Tax=Caulobacter mirabilis TaxID=69666 RepID=A0A2D2AXU9_9CAUL|nr:hypothetical protein CSW64_10525 [Caulobacter mirabilis]